jgi:hypothetical protein
MHIHFILSLSYFCEHIHQHFGLCNLPLSSDQDELVELGITQTPKARVAQIRAALQKIDRFVLGFLWKRIW